MDKQRLLVDVLKKVLLYGVVALFLIFFIGPVWWMGVSSISPLEELVHVPPHLFPQDPTLKSYIKLLSPGANFIKALRNITIIASLAVLVSLGIAIPAAYALSRFRFIGKETLGRLILGTQIVPAIVLVIPLFIIMKTIHLLNNYLSLVIIYSVIISPYLTWILRGFFGRVPIEIEEAALIDGCSRTKMLSKIVVPLTAPGVLACALFGFVVSWGEFMLALILTSDYRAKTITVATTELIGRHHIEYNTMCAGGIISLLIPAVLTLVFHRYFVAGLTSGAVKE